MRKRLPILAVVLVACLAILGHAVFRPFPSGKVTNWRLPPGEGVRSVARRLVKEGRIPSWSGPLFRAVARARGLDRHLRAGFYRMDDRMSVWSAVEILSGPVGPGIRFTLPEGRTCQDLSGILHQVQLADSANFAALCTSADSASKLGIPASGLEGYLFPDTYLFGGGETPMEIARAMHHRFLDVVKASVDSSSPAWRELGLAGVVTLASIVEREAAVRTEAPKIAGVFWERLQRGIPLGADPTVRYALGKFTGPLTKSDLAVESAYNTRVYPGLPPGPIANPGSEALRAALHPDTTGGWLYFVAKEDGSREHYFARDLNQHVNFKEKAARNRRMRGG
ncbi:MAG TPA: endolytic transglycosylase MltG [Fibrobacteria bacterium]|nr:endolytic transglycosylase MltG [Fibrobacteria bacterium]